MSLIRHRQVRVAYGSQEAEVDEELAPLIVEVWKAGLATVLSCQEVTAGVAWIKFAGSKDAKRFLQIAGADSEAIDALPDAKGDVSGSSAGIWSYRVHPQGSVSVRPPRAEIAGVLERFRQHNAG